MKASSNSYPRNKIKILLLENISDSAVAELNAGGYLEIEKDKRSFERGSNSIEAVKGVRLLGIRSKTHITRKSLRRRTNWWRSVFLHRRQSGRSKGGDRKRHRGF